MIKHVLEFALPILAWLGLAFLALDGGRGRKQWDDFWYIIILPFALLGAIGLMLLLILFVRWLY